MKGNRVNIPHGRVLGGSSAINGVAFVATSKIGVDAWGALGNPGWSWEDLAPYYKKSYTLARPRQDVYDYLGLSYIDDQIAGTDGPIQVSFPDDLKDPLPQAWIATLKDLGYPMSGDPFSGSAYGGYTNAASIDPVSRQRSYSAKAYWEPVRHRSNLFTLTGATVTKLVLSNDTSVVATGVQFLKAGQTQTIVARKEVILCAGAFHSPKILELSGIGSRKILDSFHIPVVIDNPNVGENLQDQVMTGFSFEVKDGIETKDKLSNQDLDALSAAMTMYTQEQKGPLAVGGVFSYAFLPVIEFTTPQGQKHLMELIESTKAYDSEHPIQSLHTSFVHEMLQNPHEGSGGFFTYPCQGNFGGEGSGAELVQTLLPGNFYTIAVSLMHPLSRGSTHVTSSDPTASVKVDPKYLAHPLDLEIFARHVQHIWKIAETEPLRSLLKEGGQVNKAAPRDWKNLDAIKDYVRRTALSSWHPTSTCAMSPRESGGVVDHNLMVHGTRNLRVVDASIMPITPRGNPQSSVYAIAEKAADLIKQRHGLCKVPDGGSRS